MSTRKDGLSIKTVDRTIRRILDACGVDVVGGNRRVLHLRRRDGLPDVASAVDGYGFALARILATHGFAIHHRADHALVDLLECPDAGRAVDLAERVANRDQRDAAAEWREARNRGERPRGRSAEERGMEVGDETYRWAIAQTAVRLRHWLAA